MDASHILVGGLTGVTFFLLVWIELRSRRQAAKATADSGDDLNREPETSSHGGIR